MTLLKMYYYYHNGNIPIQNNLFWKNVNNIKEWERIFLILDDKCTPKHM